MGGTGTSHVNAMYSLSFMTSVTLLVPAGLLICRETSAHLFWRPDFVWDTKFSVQRKVEDMGRDEGLKGRSD